MFDQGHIKTMLLNTQPCCIIFGYFSSLHILD